MKKVGIFCDYMRIPKSEIVDEWLICRTDKEFVETITKFYKTEGRMPDLISLTMDYTPQQIEFYFIQPKGTPIPLEEFDDKTGLSSSKWLCECCRSNDIPMDFKVAVHSENVLGAKMIQDLVNSYKENKDCFLMDWKEYDYVPERKEIYDRIKERQYNEFEEELRLESIAKRLEKELLNNNNG